MIDVKILVATNNTGKLREFKKILLSPGISILSPLDEDISLDVEETGTTLKDNALIKALAFSKLTDHVTLADDSGLFVDALDGDPGVRSARYAGNNATDHERNQKLLDNLQNVPIEKRTARFKCVIALVDEGGNTSYFSGTCTGSIATESRGSQGFGYDPIFIVDGYNKTMAELTKDEKNTVSHRAKASRSLMQHIETIY